ncbi:hypothetical protein ACFLS1_05100 [Verrucomicrobiota bacterium]
MKNTLFEIGADGIDSDQIVKEIRRSVDKKIQEGVYTDSQVARAEMTNLANMKNEEQFLECYLECLREAVFVDISDFDIHERRQAFSGFFIRVKRVIWKFLKFYTYRLWSQQNRANGLLLGAIEGVDSQYRDRIKKLEERIKKLEDQDLT